MRLLFCASLLALTAGVASAQPPATTTAPPPAAPPAATASAPAASTPPAADASATSAFRAGMPVKDAQGGLVGSIARVIKTPDGATTFSVSVDGRNVNLPGNALTLSPTGDGAISTMSKAQIAASTKPPV